MVIDDESSVREALQRALEADGYKVATFPSGQAFFADAERGRFRCLVVDLNMPGMNGLALQDRLKRGRSRHPNYLPDREWRPLFCGAGNARGRSRLPAEAGARRGVARERPPGSGQQRASG